MAVMRQAKRKVGRPRTSIRRRLSFAVEPDVLEVIQRTAQQDGISMNAALEKIVREWQASRR
jgi:predicted HicB family RNase H-like nuclease